MVPHQSLRDAAISLSTTLEANDIRHAFFGGFAILERCGVAYRESKDIDCLVSRSKEDVVKLFEGKEEWMLIPQAREDYVAFFWKRKIKRPCSPLTRTRTQMNTNDIEITERGQEEEGGEVVLVELFVGIKHSHIPRSNLQSVLSPTFGAAAIPILSEEFLFRGKITACAMRNKSSDIVDVLFLIATFPRQVRNGGRKLDKRVVGAALGKHPHLKMVLQRVGIPVKQKLIGCSPELEAAKQARGIMEGEIHRGLGCAW